jgi:hypothetical protein
MLSIHERIGRPSVGEKEVYNSAEKETWQAIDPIDGRQTKEAENQ